MSKAFRFTLFLATVITLPLHAQQWSFGAGIGPFVFGKFLTRSVTLTNGETTSKVRTTLSASTRAGAAVDIGRDLNSWLGVRAEATWTRAPLRLKSVSGDSGFTVNAGKLNITTIVLPLVVSFNRHGALRFQLLGGPAYAMYTIEGRTTEGASSKLFEGTRSRWGVMGGVGAQWWWSDRFAAEGRIQDIVTSSPMEKEDFGTLSGIHIERPQHVHTTFGIRYRF